MKWDQRLFNSLETGGGVTSTNSGFPMTSFLCSSFPEEWKPKLVKIKWHLWHGNGEKALMRLDQLLETLPKEHHHPVKLLRNCVENNRTYIVDYGERQKQGLVFTNHLAESNVESLINQRCKGKQHMRKIT